MLQVLSVGGERRRESESEAKRSRERGGAEGVRGQERGVCSSAEKGGSKQG